MSPLISLPLENSNFFFSYGLFKEFSFLLFEHQCLKVPLVLFKFTLKGIDLPSPTSNKHVLQD